MVTALVLAILQFPGGMVTFLAALKDVNIAIPIAIAIATPYTTYRRYFGIRSVLRYRQPQESLWFSFCLD